jgi:predicted RNase H-like HicB family nuclease
MGPLKYSILIEWSDEDNKYIVTLPDFPNCHTHGMTYQEALQNAQEALELLVESYQEWGLPLPQPHPYIAA